MEGGSGGRGYEVRDTGGVLVERLISLWIRDFGRGFLSHLDTYTIPSLSNRVERVTSISRLYLLTLTLRK